MVINTGGGDTHAHTRLCPSDAAAANFSLKDLVCRTRISIGQKKIIIIIILYFIRFERYLSICVCYNKKTRRFAYFYVTTIVRCASSSKTLRLVTPVVASSFIATHNTHYAHGHFVSYAVYACDSFGRFHAVLLGFSFFVIFSCGTVLCRSS